MSEEIPQGEPTQQAPQLSPEEQEMLEQQMREIRMEDILAQTVASLLNLSARRIVKEDEVDLDQARVGIEAVRLLKGLLPEEVSEAIQEPLSQVQLLYAQRAGSDGDEQAPAPAEAASEGAPEAATEPPEKPGGAKLWTPGRD